MQQSDGCGDQQEEEESRDPGGAGRIWGLATPGRGQQQDAGDGGQVAGAAVGQNQGDPHPADQEDHRVPCRGRKRFVAPGGTQHAQSHHQPGGQVTGQRVGQRKGGVGLRAVQPVLELFLCQAIDVGCRAQPKRLTQLGFRILFVLPPHFREILGDLVASQTCQAGAQPDHDGGQGATGL